MCGINLCISVINSAAAFEVMAIKRREAEVAAANLAKAKQENEESAARMSEASGTDGMSNGLLRVQVRVPLVLLEGDCGCREMLVMNVY